tara:strand:- start:16025 stop:17152 length:1128 start_codon:yes stop_codon:yes gene_type:complete
MTPDVERHLTLDARVGVHLRELSRRHGLAAETIRRAMRDRGIKVRTPPPLVESEYEEAIERMDAGEPLESVSRWLGTTMAVARSMALGEYLKMPTRFWGRDDLARTRANEICQLVRGTCEPEEVSECDDLIDAILQGRVLSQVTGREQAPLLSGEPWCYTEAYRDVTYEDRRDVLEACREEYLYGEKLPVEKLDAVARRIDVPYMVVWETCIALRADKDFNVPMPLAPEPVPKSFDDIDPSVQGMLRQKAAQACRRENFYRTAEEMFADGSFGWINSRFPQAREPEIKPIPSFLNWGYNADENGDVFRKGSLKPCKLRLDRDENVEVFIHRKWYPLDWLVCTAWHGKRDPSYSVVHERHKRDCRPKFLYWKANYR